jgi:hypothetical protein
MFQGRASKVIPIVILIVSLSACLPSKLTKDDIVGEWIEQVGGSNTIEITEIQTAILCFKEDGSFTGYRIPEGYFLLSNGDNNRRIEVLGKWEIDLSKDPSANNRIQLEFAPNPQSRHPEGYGSELFYRRGMGRPTIFAWSEDEADQLRFEKLKTEEDCRKKQ